MVIQTTLNIESESLKDVTRNGTRFSPEDRTVELFQSSCNVSARALVCPITVK